MKVYSVNVTLVSFQNRFGGLVRIQAQLRSFPQPNRSITTAAPDQLSSSCSRNVPYSSRMSSEKRSIFSGLRIPNAHRVVARSGYDELSFLPTEGYALDVALMTTEGVAKRVGENETLIILENCANLWRHLWMIFSVLNLKLKRLFDEIQQALRRCVDVSHGFAAFKIEDVREPVHQRLPCGTDSVPVLVRRGIVYALAGQQVTEVLEAVARERITLQRLELFPEERRRLLILLSVD
mmetsp:Transcript_37640/g.150102  ORF Transcript_37640/g.150102 Transcript_37640/m.150102 type:complete len:237 (+) Transcript_37640:1695-2405(+)